MKLGLFLFLFSSIAMAIAPPTAPENFYQLLGVPPSSTPAEIEAAYLRAKQRTTNPQLNAQLEVAHQILTTPELKTQYDQGKRGDLEVSIPLDQREKLAELLKPIHPEKASLLKKTGKITVHTLNNGLSFYLAMGASEAWSCFRKKDPNSCRAYMQSLKETSGHVSLALFMGASHVASRGLQKITISGKKIPQRAAGLFGLAAGSFVSEVFMEFYNHPHFDAYLKARYIEDPAERKQKQDEALQKLHEETFGDEEWYKHKIPTLTELLAASTLSEMTLHGYDKVMQNLNLKVQQAAAARGPSSTLNTCEKMIASLANISSGQAGAKLTGKQKWAYNRAREGGGLLLFFAWAGIINHPIEEGFNLATLYPDLKDSRQKVNALRAEKDLDQTKLETLLEKNSKLWDKYRKNQMSKAEEVMVLHSQQMQQFEQEVKKPYLYYTWLLNGGAENDQAWEAIRDSYYSYGTKANDIKVIRDKEKYLGAFFCGPKPENSFQDTIDIHGIPIPGRMTIGVEPFQVAAADPKLCEKNRRGQYSRETVDAWKKKLQGKEDYQMALTEAYSRLQVTANNSRFQKLALYEARVDKKIVSIMEGEKTNSSLPTGVLPSFEAEIKDLEAMRVRFAGTTLALIVENKISEAQQKQEAAKGLLAYMKAPPAERAPPEQDLEALLGLVDTENEQEWQKAVRYYNGFVLQ